MSDEKGLSETRRWLQTARGDLESARLLATGRRWAHACFHSQQAAEKGLKALWYRLDLEPWGHSVLRPVEDLEAAAPDAFARLIDLREAAGQLDRLYVPTRYPNGLPDLVPDQAFFESDALHAPELSTAIVDRVAAVVG